MRVSPSALLRTALALLLLLLALAAPLRAQMDGVDNDWAPETVVRVLQEATDAEGSANARARASANARAAAADSSQSDSQGD
ncbi:Protein of unknown function [Gryllus bimaculatus]|nr:Protein of unknown function [Gryllus bimaculatus]